MVKKESIELTDIFPEVEFNPKFISDYSKRVKSGNKKNIRVQLKKIICYPKAGKPMSNLRKGTRELYLSPFRIAYLYIEDEDLLAFLRIYHKDNQ